MRQPTHEELQDYPSVTTSRLAAMVLGLTALVLVALAAFWAIGTQTHARPESRPVPVDAVDRLQTATRESSG